MTQHGLCSTMPTLCVLSRMSIMPWRKGGPPATLHQECLKQCSLLAKQCGRSYPMAFLTGISHTHLLRCQSNAVQCS